MKNRVTPPHHWSRSSRIGASVVLSTAYLIAAIGLWLVQSNRLAADTTTPATGPNPDHQLLPLVSTYTTAQQSCLQQALGAARYGELTTPTATTLLTAAETETLRGCLSQNPPPSS